MSTFPGTWLAEKLGIEAGSRLAFVNEPKVFREVLGELPADVQIVDAADGRVDVILYFSTRHGDLDERFAELRELLSPSGYLWVAWPKKVPGIPAAVVEEEVREKGLAAGLLENKLRAIDDTWYGMRFVR